MNGTQAQTVEQIPAYRYRHPKEYLYFLLAAIVGGLIWVGLFALVLKVPAMLIFVLYIAIPIVLLAVFSKAYFFGHAVHVSPKQFPELYNMAQESAARLGLKKLPYIFIVNGQGNFNAFALRFAGRGFVVLMSNLTDHYLKTGGKNELNFIITHELAHHAAGHTIWWKNLLTMFAIIIPYLGSAYSRACEYTCDRAGVLVCNDVNVAEKALLSLAHGSDTLAQEASVSEFAAQDAEIPRFFGYMLEIMSSHPRTTRRVLAVRDFMTKR